MDLGTLWYLTLATLLVSGAMTLWERKASALRSRELGVWAMGFVTLATGCLIATQRGLFPAHLGSALTNIVMLAGYLFVLQGIVSFDRRYRYSWSVSVVAIAGLVWGFGGGAMTATFWHYVSSFPIAAITGLSAYALYRGRSFRGLRTRPLAVAVFAFHSGFYLARALIMPVVVAHFGNDLLTVFAKATMLEGVLFSVAMPMSLIALVREEYQASLLETSRTDHLTGLSNRRGFFEGGEKALKGAIRRAQPVSLLAFDLDHFKAINDRYGHGVGDRVLTLFAETASDLAGAEAVAGRLGGEEFALLLVNTTGNDARAVGEAIAKAFEQKVATDGGLTTRATVSIGVAESKAQDTELRHLLSAADRALYRAKSLGRNRVELAKAVGISVAA